MATTELTRLREKATPDRAELDRLLDEAFLAHVGLADDSGGVVVIPTGLARDGDSILIHGSTGSGWMRRLAAGAPACVTVTDLTGIVVARSSFESSFRYRSAVLFGAFGTVAKPGLPRALDLLTEHFLPGRTAEIRRPTSRELAATMVLRMPIDQWSLKISEGWPEDDERDLDGDAWAGVIPLRSWTPGDPLPAPDLRAGIPVPASVRARTQPVVPGDRRGVGQRGDLVDHDAAALRV
ncbi:MAG TPA: pyridoxamine 5'-phosphate oxidase family protein [Streptosporangiaceae bacterium]|nr:pyridoxamine 5'-phosphate oxidase family protein [Streptosporangiaceae bacterium]